ncbi:MAG: Spermine synthase [Candidatus Sulfotelmatobacter sp.]|nr:Spermine synthase [Candidatus Sulfotelmatobacter sp.]
MAGATAVAPILISDQKVQGISSAKSQPWWYLFFFISGFPALLYQIVWERALFTLYGINIESVTMVVTAFLVGLGIGSLLGGIFSRYERWSLLRIFGIVELLIGLYGIFSLNLFHWAAKFTAGSSPLQTGLIAFTLVALPTVLMGATLPLLVSYTVRLSHNVGTSVGALYAVNTLGSAAACFCAGLFLMRSLGQAKTVALAASLNALVGASVLAWQFFRRKLPSDTVPQNDAAPPPITEPSLISFPTAVVIGGVAGFISLGYEIVWFRLFSFTTGGLAKSFAFLLGAYLAGIAGGSVATNRVCKIITKPQTFIRFLVATVFGANLLGFLVGPILFNSVIHASYLWTLLPIALAAACLGAVFPMLCHISIPPDGSAGARMSYVYLSNIAGSALGSYLTGFVLMDFLPLPYVTVVLTLLGLGLGAVLLLRAQLKRTTFLISAAAAFIGALLVVQSPGFLFHHMYEKMQLKTSYVPAAAYATVVETRSGVITVTPDGMVFGGGIYDGRFSVNLVNDANGIERPFALSYFHPNPREVLMIGLSSGSWAQVVASNPQVERLTIVEINPGYLRLIQHNDTVSSLLRNPKVHIEIDDGRRWLVRNVDRKFDAIVMNTTHHWRSNSSNLLSVEFLQLIRRHLNPGGVHFYNTTGSDEVMATGVRVFPYGMRLVNFMVVSDTPLQLNAGRWLDVLLQYRIDGKPVFDVTQPQQRRRLQEVVLLSATMDRSLPTPFTLESAPHIRARTSQTRIITDDNMGTEWFQQAPESGKKPEVTH